MSVLDNFLHRSGWDQATRAALAGDASDRSYLRLTGPQGTAVLMQDPRGDVALFARLARHLSQIGLSAPRILNAAPDHGLLLVEDLGDGLVARLCQTDPTQEIAYYTAAGELLAHLHQQPLPEGVAQATPHGLGQATDLAFEHYVAGPRSSYQAAQSADLFADVLGTHAPVSDVLVLRDFHAENLIWLPNRQGVRRLGVIDFQDALIGHRAYDLASLTRDARRDVSSAAAQAAVLAYCGHAPTAEFETALAVLGAQRNLRILGIFARLARVAGKPRYLDLIPRVWAHLQADLDHPALSEIRAFLTHVLPAPTEAHLTKLRSTCPTP